LSADGVAIVATDLVTGYRGGRAPKVVTRASFSIPAGTVVALVGSNGSGKTTLLKTLLGLLPPLAGTVSVGGLRPDAYRSQEGIGFLPEGVLLPDAWTGRGLIALAALAGGQRALDSVPQALEIAGVDFDFGLPLDQMSKGMRQRVALALALVPLPRLLLLDEPEAGLDPAQRVGQRERIRRFARAGACIIVASHDVSGLLSMADQLYLLNDQAMQRLDPAELADTDRLLQWFGQRK
jgi:ABC-type multidrug transport system ATPase subunit